jgi:aminopeptidase-like protein
LNPGDEAAALERYFDRLWPLPRSITGAGLRETLAILGELLPLEITEVPSGRAVHDWIVPKEWSVKAAYIVTPDGRRICDFAVNNLHLLGYSQPFRGRLGRAELDQHLYSLPEQPDAIPYLTSYYTPRWGFCIAESERRALPEGEYEVVVDATHTDGAMTLAECVLSGERSEEVLLTSYVCHPSLANNELAGPLVLAFLYRRLRALPRRRLTYRFVLTPETIGAIAYLARRGQHLKRHVVAGYVVSSVGARAPLVYKRSRRETSLADRAALHALRRLDGGMEVTPFVPTGGDERQYCSPGYDLPVGSVMRSLPATYPEYHTSLDDKSFIDFAVMRRTIDALETLCRVVDANRRYRRTDPHGEPFLTRHGLYPTLGGRKDALEIVPPLMWLLNLADGEHDLLAIAERAGADVLELDGLAAQCVARGVLEEA